MLTLLQATVRDPAGRPSSLNDGVDILRDMVWGNPGAGHLPLFGLNDAGDPILWIAAEGQYLGRMESGTMVPVATDPLGNLVLQEDDFVQNPSAWGEDAALPPTSTTDQEFVYAGLELLPQAPGLHQSRHRLYDSDTGRFVSADPIGLGGGSNRFAYANNNPLGLVDPLGTRAVGPNRGFSPMEKQGCGFYCSAYQVQGRDLTKSEWSFTEYYYSNVYQQLDLSMITYSSAGSSTESVGADSEPPQSAGDQPASIPAGDILASGRRPSVGSTGRTHSGGRFAPGDWVHVGESEEIVGDEGTKSVSQVFAHKSLYETTVGPDSDGGKVTRYRRDGTVRGSPRGRGGLEVEWLPSEASTAADGVDWWGERRRRSQREVGRWVDEDPSLWRVLGATATLSAMDLGEGFLDAGRAGQGCAQGGWGCVTDAVRVVGLAAPATKIVAHRTGLSAAGAALGRKLKSSVGRGKQKLATSADEVLEAETAAAVGASEGAAGACFVAGSEVLTPGGWVPIEAVDLGESIVARQLGEAEQRSGGGYAGERDVVARVIAKFVRLAPAVIDAQVLFADGSVDTLTGTPNHPFWVGAVRDYVPLGELEPGTVLHVQGGGEAILVSKTWRQGDFEVFDIEVEGLHNFYVRGGGSDAAGVLVHNSSLRGSVVTKVEAMSDRARSFQRQVAGLSDNQVYRLNGVAFDGARGGRLLDAKGPGYARFVKDGEFQPWFRGKDDLAAEARRQLKAAGGAPIEWHVAEEPALDAMQKLFHDEAISGINLIHTPIK